VRDAWSALVSPVSVAHLARVQMFISGGLCPLRSPILTIVIYVVLALGLGLCFERTRSWFARLGLFALLAMAVVGWSNVPSLRAAGAQLSAARAAEREGKPAAAASLYFDVLAERPAATAASLRYACLAWREGFRDQALVLLQQGFRAGMTSATAQIPRACFLPGLRQAGVRSMRIQNRDVLYVVPANGTSRSAKFEEVFKENLSTFTDSPSPSRFAAVEYSAFCLADEADFKALASLFLATGYTYTDLDDLDDLDLPGAEVLQECVHKAWPKYVHRVNGNIVEFKPTDAASRLLGPMPVSGWEDEEPR